MSKNLQSSEWIFVSAILILLATLIAISRLHEHRRALQIKLFTSKEEAPIHVSVEGAVLKPGCYEVTSGTLLKEVLRKSRPKRFANLREIDPEEVLKGDRFIQIEELTSIRVRVEGEVFSPIDLELPVGSRVSDLKVKIECTSHADRGFLKNRRLLKDGEIIEVPATASCI